MIELFRRAQNALFAGAAYRIRGCFRQVKPQTWLTILRLEWFYDHHDHDDDHRDKGYLIIQTKALF